MTGGLAEVVDGVWIVGEPVRIVGMPLHTNMTVLRLDGGQLLLHSPVPCTDALREQVEGLGRVAHLYAPNTFHHRWLGEWATAFPYARVHAPAGLRQKRPDLRIDRHHDERPEPRFADLVDERHVDGFRLEETVVHHRSSGSLVVGDLLHNIGRPAHPWTRVYASLMGFYGRVAQSRVLRWSAFDDRAAAHRSVQDILALPFEHVLVGHGAPIVGAGRAAFAEACAWLAP